MKTKFFSISLVLLSALAVMISTASAHEEIFSASLSGPAEFPINDSPGTGSTTVTLDLDVFTMRVQVNFSGLTGTTTASHIHAPTVLPFEGTASVATALPTFPNFPLGVTSGTYDQTFDLTLASSYNPAFVTANGGSVSASAAALISAIEQGKAYLNIHTLTFGGGEIRGFLAPIPEPATISFLTIGGAGLVLALGRKRRAS